MGSKPKPVTVGYRYYLGIHFVLTHGELDAMTRISVDDREAWTGTSTGGRINISADSLFGGEKREGGISGAVDFLTGTATQGQNDYLVSQLGADVPAYRRVASVILRQVYVGLNPYLKKWAFRCRRIMKRTNGQPQWYLAKAAIGQDMNPAHIILECLTDPDWGMGYPEADMDLTAFQYAADVLFDEGFGLSILWDKQASIEDFVNDILRHIEASLYVDRTTGKFTLKLMRNDYVVDNLKILDEDNILSVTDFKCSTFTELVNTVSVDYWDSSTGRTGSVTVQDIAAVQVQGATILHPVEYGGVSNADLANRLASRDLMALSTPLTRCTVKVNRIGSTLRPGEPVRFRWPAFGVTEMVMRVAGMELGTPEEGGVTVTLIQDVFSMGTSIYAPPSSSEWTPIRNAPQPATNRITMEAPYYALARLYGDAEVQRWLTDEPNLGMILTAASRPTNDSLGATIMVNSGSTYEEVGYLDFCAYGELAGPLTKTTTTIDLNAGKDLYEDMVTVGSYAAIGNEIIEIVSISGNTLTFKRGCLDTVPLDHSTGAKVFFIGDFASIIELERVSGETLEVKLLPITGQGQLTIGAAPSSSVTLARRALRPYPPGNFKINDVYYPPTLEEVSISASWAHRHRLQQTGANLIDFTEGNVGPEPDTTYTVRLHNHTASVLLHETTGITGTSHSSFPALTGTYTLRLELWSVRDGWSSTFMHSHVFGYVREPQPAANPPFSAVSVLMHMDGDDNGTVFTDVKGLSVTRVGSALTKQAIKKYGTASLHLPGSGSYLSINTSGTDNLVFGTGDFTIEGYIRTTTAGKVVFDMYSGSTGWQLFINGSGVLVWYAGTTAVKTGTIVVTNNEMRHVAVTRSSGVIRLFVDGAEDGVGVSNSTNHSVRLSPFSIGAQVISRNAAYDFVGYVDEVRVTKGVAVYTSSFLPPDAQFPDA